MCLIERDKYVWCLPKEQLPYMFKIDSVKTNQEYIAGRNGYVLRWCPTKKALNQLDKK